MSGNSKQDRQKSDRRLARQTPDPPDGEVHLWEPSPGEPVSEDVYSIVLSAEDRVVVRMTRLELNDQLISFAVIQQVGHYGKWDNVAAVDTRHGTLHCHWYSRVTGARTGTIDHIKNLTSEADIDDAYDVAYGLILEKWKQNKVRWHNA